MTTLPEILEYWSVDEVAECAPVSPATYDALWDYLNKVVKADNAKPLGGDGTDGTFEEPVITSGDYGSDLAAAWSHLSDEVRKDIARAAEVLEAEEAEYDNP